MDKVLKVRQPAEQSQVALSKASKIFFGCDIFQGKRSFNSFYLTNFLGILEFCFRKM